MAFHDLHGAATTTGHTGQGIFGNNDGQRTFIGQQLVNAAQQGTTTGEDNTLINDIGRQFRRGQLQGNPNSINNHIHLFGNGRLDLLGRDGQGEGEK